MRNIELKAKLADLDAARSVAASLATRQLGTQRQTDTYFRCQQGRLKLREVDGFRAHLVWYERIDRPAAKQSKYVLVPISNPQSLKAALSAALGIRVVVSKQREIFLVDNVRIHLDEVDGLGSFLEFEAGLGPLVDDAKGHEQLRQLSEAFSIAEADLEAGSYADLMERNS